MREPGQASMVLLRALIRASAELGVERSRLLARIELDEADLERDGGIAQATLLSAWHAAPELSGDPLFGLRAGMHAEIGDYDILDHLFMTSPTLGAACEEVGHYFRILTELASVRVVFEGELAHFQHHVVPALVDPLRHAWDFFFTGAIKRLRAATATNIALTRIGLMHDGAGHAARYREFLGTEVAFSQPVGEIVLARGFMDAPLVGANAKLHRVLARYADQMLARVPARDDVVGSVRASVEEHLSDADISLTAVARRLGASRRSLQRRLDEHGVRFRDLVDAVREERATRRLENPSVSLSELSEELGFSSLAAFHRAFVRWHGVTPSRFRAELRRRAG